MAPVGQSMCPVRQCAALLSESPPANLPTLHPLGAPPCCSKNLKQLLARKALPDLGRAADVAEFLTRSGYGSVRLGGVCVGLWCGSDSAGCCCVQMLAGGGAVSKREQLQCLLAGTPASNAPPCPHKARPAAGLLQLCSAPSLAARNCPARCRRARARRRSSHEWSCRQRQALAPAPASLASACLRCVGCSSPVSPLRRRPADLFGPWWCLLAARCDDALPLPLPCLGQPLCSTCCMPNAHLPARPVPAPAQSTAGGPAPGAGDCQGGGGAVRWPCAVPQVPAAQQGGQGMGGACKCNRVLLVGVKSWPAGCKQMQQPVLSKFPRPKRPGLHSSRIPLTGVHATTLTIRRRRRTRSRPILMPRRRCGRSGARSRWGRWPVGIADKGVGVVGWGVHDGCKQCSGLVGGGAGQGAMLQVALARCLVLSWPTPAYLSC